tara:strand:+ start:363 stop:623 length:261 start_codon:yes stop_codon:yes gene_type:complete
MKELIGLTIVAVKGYKEKDARKKNPRIEPVYIFFNDEETYIQLDEQDYHEYHDCSSSARILNINKDKEYYKNMFTWDGLVDANTDI